MVKNETHVGEEWKAAQEDVEMKFNNTVLDKLENNDDETLEILAVMEYVYRENVVKVDNA